MVHRPTGSVPGNMTTILHNADDRSRFGVLVKAILIAGFMGILCFRNRLTTGGFSLLINRIDHPLDYFPKTNISPTDGNRFLMESLCEGLTKRLMS